MAMKGYSAFPKAPAIPQNLTIRLFSVISRILVGKGFYPSAEKQLVYSTSKADWGRYCYMDAPYRRKLNVWRKSLSAAVRLPTTNTKTIKVRRTRHAGHCRRIKGGLISDVLLWNSSHGRTKVGRPTRTYIQQLSVNTGCNLEDLSGAMNDRDGSRERVWVCRASNVTWSWSCLNILSSLNLFTIPRMPSKLSSIFAYNFKSSTENWWLIFFMFYTNSLCL